MTRFTTLSIVLAFSAASLLVSAPFTKDAPSANLFVNGDFRLDRDGDGWPDGWSRQPKGKVVRKGAACWLVLDGGDISTGQTVKLKPEWWKLKLALRMRATDVIVGKQSWQNARFAMSFYDKQGKRVGNWPNVFGFAGTTDWIDCERVYAIPRGAATLKVSASNFGPSGKAEFADIRLVVVRERTMTRADAPLPEGATPAQPVSVGSARHCRICLNGLWRFRPVAVEADAAAPPKPGDCWGWFKVPGIWPGSDWRAPDVAQTVHLAPWLEENMDLRRTDRAWYKRSVRIPASTARCRRLLEFTMLQTHARVFVDGKDAGEVWFPGGLLDITGATRPGATHEIAVLVTARPLQAGSRVFMAPDRIMKSKAYVKLKGITGDVFLRIEPAAAAIADVHVITSVARKQITFDVGVRGASLPPQAELSAEIRGPDGTVVRRFASEGSVVPRNGRFRFSAPWPDPLLWDTHTPRNLYTATVDLKTGVKTLDTSLPVRFGFREITIDGKNLLLNGRRIHLRALHNTTINSTADKACLAGARETVARMREYGFNFLITGNYSFSPGEVGYMDGLLDACDETGMLMSFSLPHVKDFAWKIDQPEMQKRYRRLCEWLIRRVQNHPGVILYALDHNACGYTGDQNPLKIDGIYNPDVAGKKTGKENASLARRRRLARLARSIVRELDPTRPAYHHESGNLDDMHTVNIYLNWAPRQERSEWLRHWSEKGKKPLFFVEWGMPHISSWSSYRGPQFIWRCDAFQSLWNAEFAAAYLDQTPYRMTPKMKNAIALEERLWATGKPFRWSSLCGAIRNVEQTHGEIMSFFGADNWRAHRTWGISAMLPWDQGEFWDRVKTTASRENTGRYDRLGRPGIVPDRFTAGSQYIYDTGPKTNFAPSSVGRMLQRWNGPLCAFIGGATNGQDPAGFTDKTHNAFPNETLKKTLVILNDRRTVQNCRYAWKLGTGGGGTGTVAVNPGERVLIPITVRIPPDASPGPLVLAATFRFAGNETQTDTFSFDILAPRASGKQPPRPFLWDPVGSAAAAFHRLGMPFTDIGPTDTPPADAVLVVGQKALGNVGSVKLFDSVPAGARVLVLAQDAQTLMGRLGFRMNVHGLRRVFPRVPGHPALAGLTASNLTQWRGASRLVPPYLDTAPFETHNPTWEWCGFNNTRVWRCGNTGSVATVLIEKPVRGDWLPLVDGGFDLQYAPLLETKVGRGRIVFCQLDTVGRTVPDPAADRLLGNLVSYLAAAPVPRRSTVAYAGATRTEALLRSLGVRAAKLSAGSKPDVIVVGPGATAPPGIQQRVRNGLSLLCLGLAAKELRAWVPDAPALKRPAPTSSGWAESFVQPELTGISNADVHWRTQPMIEAFADPAGLPALRVLRRGKGTVVICQAPPWVFDAKAKPYLRTTWRRTTFLVSRLLANLGAEFDNTLLERLASPRTRHSVDLPHSWVGMEDPKRAGRDAQWWRSDFDDSAWRPIAVPGTFESARPELKDYNGLFWYRLHFRTPEGIGRNDLKLFLGGIDDESWVWLNNRFLGEVTKKTRPKDYWAFPREYPIEPGILRGNGPNTLIVLVNDTYQTGGILGTPRLHCRPPWLDSYYAQVPVAGDDPYRYYRW